LIETFETFMTHPIRIAVIAHALRSAGGLSVGLELIDNITRIAPQNKYLFLIPEGLGYEEMCERIPDAEIITLGPMGLAKRVWQDRFVTPKIIKNFAPDSILALDSSLGLTNPPCPQTIFLHAPQLLYPKSHYGPRNFNDKLRHKYLNRHFRLELKNTQTVICQTEVMESRLREYFNFSNRTVVCGTSVPESIMKIPSDEAVPAAIMEHSNRLNLFYPTRYYPHKNIEVLVDLFRDYSEELTDVTAFLTISPDQHPNVQKLLTKIDRLNLGKNLVNLGHIPYESIGAHFRNVDGMLMPSLLESFSTTYVEAMATGLPILTSDLDFARASCGDAASYFDPFNTESIKNSIVEFRDNESLRFDLAQAGAFRVQSEVNTWNDIANTVISEAERITTSN